MKNKSKTVIALILLCVVIAVIPLLLIKDSEFGGADGAAEDAILQINADYEPWTEPMIEPPGGETESLLFCLQAALGAGIIGFGFGTLKERSKKGKEISKMERG